MQARNREPSIIYFDEIDGIGLRRSAVKAQTGHPQALGQLLTEIQGTVTGNLIGHYKLL